MAPPRKQATATAPEQPPAGPLGATDAPAVHADTVVENAVMPDLVHCGSCKVGLLYPIAWDEAASHEQNQGAATHHDGFVPSGGSALYRCFNCGLQSSQALNPGQAS